MKNTGRRPSEFRLQTLPMPDDVAKRLIPHHLMKAAQELGIVRQPKKTFDAKDGRVYIDCDFSSLELRIWAEMINGFNR
jgi:hypothetical protein